MFHEKNPYVRALYIILVPIVLLIILLNSGWLQRVLPAASLNQVSYSVVAYDYYYFDYYNRFLEKNSEKLSELGYDSSVSNGQQDYDDTMTWREYFLTEGEKELAEAKYFYDQALSAGYEFSEDELLPISEQLEKNEEIRSAYGLKENNFYISYYGRGMDEDAYMKQLTLSVKAKAYKNYLIHSYQPSEEELESYLSQHPENDYQTVSLSIITLDAESIRGESSAAASIGALQERLSRLESRYDAGESFSDLQTAFSTKKLGGSKGKLTDATRADLPDIIADALLTDQDSLKIGESYAFLDEESGIAYFILLEGLGDSGLEKEASIELGKQKTEEQLADALAGDYKLKRNSLGMLLSAN